MSLLNKKMKKMKSFKARIPATEEQISEAEGRLGLSFSNEYKEYLAEFGCASVYGHELTGLCKVARLDVVQVTLTHKDLNPDFPCSLYVIEETTIDGIIIWQDSDGLVYASSPNGKIDKIAGSILEYLS